jgi:ribosomal protein S18 acetylase RimI-like enzyme
MVSFREVSVDDDSARALLTEYFGARAQSFPATQGTYRTTFPTPTDFVPPRGVFLVVEGEDLAGDASDVGCGGIRLLDSPDVSPDSAGIYEVKHLWLQPHTRGLGLGRALLAELEARARQLGATALVLDTNVSLEAAGGLYRSSGFVEVPAYNNNPNANLWLRKALTPAP